MRISSKPQDCKRKFYENIGSREGNYELKKIGTYAVNIQIIVAGQAINHKYVTNHILNHLDEELSERLIKDVAVLINKNISEIAGYRTESGSAADDVFCVSL